MSITILPATPDDAAELTPIGIAAYANDKLFGLARSSTTATPAQQAEFVQWRIDRNKLRMQGDGQHWFKAVDELTGRAVGIAAIQSPQALRAAQSQSSASPPELPSAVNRQVHEEIEQKMAKGKAEFFGGREDVWYVPSMCVHPDYQGRGIAKQMLDKVCGVADEAGQDVYLEASPAGKKLYVNAGFAALGTVDFLSGEYVMTCMLRKAKPL